MTKRQKQENNPLKINRALLREWEEKLKSEGLEEISLFDSTGKPGNDRQASRVRFVSESVDDSDFPANANPDWPSVVNVDSFGVQTSIADLPQAIYYQALSQAVSSLPPGWPPAERKLLERWAETGNFASSARELGIDPKASVKIRERFERWKKDRVL